MLYANVCISKGSKTLHGWYIHSILYEIMFKEFFYKLINYEILSDTLVDMNDFEQIKCIDLSKSTNLSIETTQTSSDYKIIELI
ncbi:1245_t:CDS:1, partial [Scutellospora calospora]